MPKTDVFDDMELFDPVEWFYKGGRRVGIVWAVQKGKKLVILEFGVPGTHYEKIGNEEERFFLLPKEEVKIEKLDRVIHLAKLGEKELRRALPRTIPNRKGGILYHYGEESPRPISIKEARKIKEEIENDRD